MAEAMAFFVVTGDVVATGGADGMSKTVLQLGQRIRLPKTPSATRSRAWHEPHSTRMAILGDPMSIEDCTAILAREMLIGYVFLFDGLKIDWAGSAYHNPGGDHEAELREMRSQAEAWERRKIRMNASS